MLGQSTFMDVCSSVTPARIVVGRMIPTCSTWVPWKRSLRSVYKMPHTRWVKVKTPKLRKVHNAPGENHAFQFTYEEIEPGRAAVWLYS